MKKTSEWIQLGAIIACAIVLTFLLSPLFVRPNSGARKTCAIALKQCWLKFRMAKGVFPKSNGDAAAWSPDCSRYISKATRDFGSPTISVMEKEGSYEMRVEFSKEKGNSVAFSGKL